MDFIKQVFAQFSNDRCTTLAASLAYYTAFALPPLLYLLLTLLTYGLGVMYDREISQQKAHDLIKSQASQMIGNPSASDEIATILENNRKSEGKWWKTLISFVGIVIGATGVVAALQAALNQVWEVKPDPDRSSIKDFFSKRLISFAMILGLGFLLLVSLVISSILSAISNWIGIAGIMGEIINFGVQAIVLLVMFAAIFKYMPDAKIAWRDVLIGSAITTVLFLVGRLAMQVYFTYSEPGAQLGAAAASFAVLLAWVYYTAIIVLLGAEATQVYASHSGRSIRPEPGAVRVAETLERSDSRV